MQSVGRKTGWLRSMQLVGALCMCVLFIQVVQAQPKNKTQASIAQAPLQTTRQEMGEHTDDLRALMLALYTQHPDELAKSTKVGPREMTEWVFDGKANWKFEGIRRLQAMPAIDLVFDPEYTGDHVLALVVGLETLLFEAYGSQNEFEIPPARDDGKLQALSCQLHELQGRLDKNTRADSVLNEAQSRKEVTLTISQLRQRIQLSNQTVPNQQACR